MRPILACLIATTALLAGCGPDPSNPSMTEPSGTSLEPLGAAKAGFGGISIVLDLQPNRAVDLAYTTAGKKLSGFTLDEDPTSALPNSRTFGRLKHRWHRQRRHRSAESSGHDPTGAE